MMTTPAPIEERPLESVFWVIPWRFVEPGLRRGCDRLRMGRSNEHGL